MAKRGRSTTLSDMRDALKLLEEMGFSREEIASWLKEAITTAYKKICNDAILVVDIESEGGAFKIDMHEERIVADDDKELYEDYEITLEEAQEINPNYKVGQKIETPVDMSVFGRTDSSKIKNMLKQKIREAQKLREFDYFKSKENEIITGTVERIDPNGKSAMINLGQGQVSSLKNKDMIPGEVLTTGQEIKVYVESVVDQLPDRSKSKDGAEDKEPKMKKGTFIRISRRNDELVIRLFESVVTEIVSNGKPGPVSILGIAREAGKRTKMAVVSSDPNIDPIGACVGPKGIRAKSVSDELGGEKIDIIQYDKDIKKFIANALSPAEVTNIDKDIILNQETKEAFVIVPDEKYSLAIGKAGINTKLASKLINTVAINNGKADAWNIKIKKASEADEVLQSVDEEFMDREEFSFTVDDFMKEETNEDTTVVVEEETVFEENEISKAANVEEILSEMNEDLNKNTVAEVEVEVEEEEDNYEDDEYLDTLSEYEELYD